MGTPAFAVPALKSIIAAKYNVVGVYSQPPRPAGRGMHMQKSPIQLTAEASCIPVFTPNNFKSNEDVQVLKDLKPDLVIVAAYGLILPKIILETPKYGCINIHGSLLPRWRGAAPIHRAILAGDTVTGITIMQMDVGLDTGDMLVKGEVSITNETTTPVLYDTLANMGASLIMEVIKNIDNIKPIVQPEEGVTYANKLSKDEGLISWDMAAEDIHRKLRALHPWPGVWFDFRGKRIKILDAKPIDWQGKEPIGTIVNSLTVKCAEGSLQLLLLQPEGKKSMSGEDFVNGYQLKPGMKLE